MKNHGLRMLLGCALPLLFVFLMPLFGISGGVGVVIFLVLMFACHLLMMRDHGHHHNEAEEGQDGAP